LALEEQVEYLWAPIQQAEVILFFLVLHQLEVEEGEDMDNTKQQTVGLEAALLIVTRQELELQAKEITEVVEV